jgi:hypothetical protein
LIGLDVRNDKGPHHLCTAEIQTVPGKSGPIWFEDPFLSITVLLNSSHFSLSAHIDVVKIKQQMISDWAVVIFGGNQLVI